MDPQHQQLQQRAAQLMSMGNVSGAGELLQEMISRYPQDWLSAVQLAEIYQSQQRFDAALKLVDQALAIQPDNAKLIAKYGLIAQQAGQPRLAVDAYQRALRRAPSQFAHLHFNLGNSFYALGDFESAAQSYETFLAGKPDHVNARSNLAMALERLFRFDDAAAQWESLNEAEPHESRWAVLRAALELKRESLEAADQALEIAATRGADDETYLLNLASLRFEQGRHQESLQVLDRLAAKTGGAPQDPGAQRLRFLNDFQAGHYPSCLDQADQLVAGSNRETAMIVLSLLPQVWLESGEGERAREAQRFSELVQRSRPSLDPVIFPALEEQILCHPSLEFEPVTTSTHNGSQTQSLLVPGSSEIDALLAQLRSAAVAQASLIRRTDTRYGSLLPESGRIKMWAVTLSSGGFQGSHMHPHGVISGVFYLKVPVGDNPDEGALELGFPEPKFQLSTPPLTSLQRVVTGDLVLFPSWYFHRTLPFSSEERRISIAFDVVPPDSPEWHDPGLSDVFSLTAS
ncbi:MAG: tetratricopeptide repeat protein [Pseudomonadota bacterium]